MRSLKTLVCTVVAGWLLSVCALAQQDVISTIIGGGPNNIPALHANLYSPYGVTVDGTGNVYITSYNQNRVFKVNTSGTLTVFAGSGALGFTGDGVTGGAGNASLSHPFGTAIDASGNVYIADFSNCVVRKVTVSTNTITTVAGIGSSCGFSGDGGPATAAQLNNPAGVALDSAGNVLIADYNNCRIRKISIGTGKIATYAGNGTCGFSGDTGPAVNAELNIPAALALDSANNVYIADTSNYVIREVKAGSGIINSIAGTHTGGYSGDGGKATSAMIQRVYGIAVNGAGTTVTFSDYDNQRIRQFTVAGNINTVAGNGTACTGVCGAGGAATSAELYYPQGVAVTSAGTVYFSDNANYYVDNFTVGGNLNNFAGDGTYNVETLVSGVSATGAQLSNPYGLSVDASGNVFVNDGGNCIVRESVKATNLLNIVAGNATCSFLGDGGAATSAELYNAIGDVIKDTAGNLYIADTYNCVVRVVNTAGVISTFAGVHGQCGFTGDGGPATSAKLYFPYGLAVDNAGSIYIADANNHAIRKVSSGTISTIAGIGTRYGYAGDGGPATAAMLYTPSAVAVDPAGNVFIADYNNCRVREVFALTGTITTVAGSGTGACSYTGDGPAVDNGVGAPQGVAVDANDNLFITGSNYTNRVQWVSPSGWMTSIAGSGVQGYTGDGGLATSAELSQPTGLAFSPAGDILVSDYSNGRVRSISAFAALNTNTGNLAFTLTSVGTTSPPQPITVSALGSVTISNISTTGSFSEVDDCPASMTAGSSCTMYVYFSPTASGNSVGSITLNSNGYFYPVTTVGLTGVGSAISLSGAPVNFGNQAVKTTSAAQTVTVKNTGTTAITMGTIGLSETTDFAISANTCPASGAKLNGGVSCTIGLTFGPKSTGVLKGAVVINDSDPSSPQLIGVSGTGTSKVSLSPGLVAFGVVPVGVTTASTKITLTNTTAGNITLGNPAITVTGAFGSAATTTCTNNLVIAANGTCVINATFKPTGVGFTKGTISVADSDSTSPQVVGLQGTGTAVKFTPATVNFGTVTRGQQVNSLVTITNVGTTPLGFTGAEIFGANSADYTDNYIEGPPCGNGVTAPLQPGATCILTVYFTPSKVGTENASYKVFDSSPASPQTLALTGKGQ